MPAGQAGDWSGQAICTLEVGETDVAAGEKLNAAQGVQTMSVVAVEAVEKNVPAGHEVEAAWHVVRSGVENVDGVLAGANVPTEHATHTRSE